MRLKVSVITNFKNPETSMLAVIRFLIGIGYFTHTDAALGLYNYSNTTISHSNAGLPVLIDFVGLAMDTESLNYLLSLH